MNSAILKQQAIPVLDDGYVLLLDVMGSDRAIAEAAWISTDADRGSEEDRSETDVRTVIRYMMRHRHTSPFEMAEMKFRLRLPMDVWRQGVRHRTANVNEYSTRYSPAINSMHKTKADRWRLQSKSNHQGSEGLLDSGAGAELSEREAAFQALAREVYEHRLQLGVAREQARKDLPLSTFTEVIWKCDVHNLLHFLGLRLAKEAQWEIRQYAEAISLSVRNYFPYTWEAFVDYQLEAHTFSRLEMKMLRFWISRVDSSAFPADMTARERREFLAALNAAVYVGKPEPSE